MYYSTCGTYCVKAFVSFDCILEMLSSTNLNITLAMNIDIELLKYFLSVCNDIQLIAPLSIDVFSIRIKVKCISHTYQFTSKLFKRMIQLISPTELQMYTLVSKNHFLLIFIYSSTQCCIHY